MPAELSLIHYAALIAIFIILSGMFLSFYRLVRGPSLPDRVVAVDLVTTLALGIIVAYTRLTGQPVFLNAAATLALIVFLGTVAFARYFEKRISK